MNLPTTPAEHQRQVCATFAGTDPRTAEVLRAAVRHLSAFVEEVGLSREEWRTGIDFLTAVGQKCDGERQEFILLSDTLGVSMLLEMVNDQPGVGATVPTVLGPFYVPGAARRSYGDSIVDDPSTGGEPLVLHGAVRDLDGNPVPGATIDVWEVQPNGLYDIEEDGEKRNLRGVFTALDDGRYQIRMVRPVDYTIPDDGPVGEMLRVTGRQSWRPAHVHLMVRAPGFRPLVTHVFDQQSPWLGQDAVFGVRDSIIAPMSDGSCSFDLVVERI
ncbi:MAG: 6-chlorohydroxyquinol-1,2-dioxygenase [Actinomycetota bacterium]|nr:6-chlorohydroxyquinol-1,2-dioxygenase [Actinomycetota bacterium]